jgi:hypothetical protein
VLTGSCLCRAVRFEIRGELGSIVYCHCESCRKAQGTAFAANAPVAAEGFVLTSGAELVAKYESSPGKYRCFCRNCGSPVYSYRASIPGTVRVRLGTLDVDPGSRPVLHSWVGEKAPWFEITDGVPQFRTGDPASLIAGPSADEHASERQAVSLGWGEFTERAPDLAAAGRRLLRLDDRPLAFLATVTGDGRPRVAPVCPILAGGELYVSVGAHTPKVGDLRERGAFALHALPGMNDEEFQLGGRAVEVGDAAERASVHRAIRFPVYNPADPVFALRLDRCHWALWEEPAERPTRRASWRA